MDIREWLQNTADREPPDQQDDHGFPDFFQPHRDTPPEPQPAHQRQRKRKRAPSEPSPRQRPHTAERRRRVTARSSSPARPKRPRTASTTSRSSQSSPSEESEDVPHGKEPAKTYERRARHKTRPDRYDPKPKKHRKERGPKDDKKPKAKRRKSRRSADGARTSGLVQSFQLKNGPKNNRLTLRPDISAGIFKHGRASAPVAPSGPGLPDLVFNEMKFLQKPKDHQDELPADDSAKQQTKKSRKQIQEEEVSTYFKKKPSTDQQYHAQRQDRRQVQGQQQTRKTVSVDRDSQQRQEREEQAAKAPVDLPEKAFLGFGSRGPAPEKNDEHPTSNSYFTWSASVAANPRGEKNDAAEPTNIESGDLLRELSRRQSKRTSHHGPPGDGDLIPAAGKWVETRRVKGSNLVQVFQPGAATSLDHESRRPSRGTEYSRGLPRYHVQGDAGSTARSSQIDGQGYHTSDILKIRDGHRSAQESPSVATEYHPPGQNAGKENFDPSTLTPSSQHLRQAFQAVVDPLRQVCLPLVGHIRSGGYPRKPVTNDDYHPAAMSTNHELGHMDTPELELPDRGGRRWMDPPNNQTRQRLHTVPFVNYLGRQSPQLLPTDGRQGIWDVGNRRDSRRVRSYLAPEPMVYNNGRQAEELVRRLALDHEPLSAEVPNGQLEDFQPPAHSEPTGNAEHEANGRYHDDQTFEGQATELPSVHTCSMSERVVSDKRMTSDGNNAADGMPGFWKPNVLY